MISRKNNIPGYRFASDAYKKDIKEKDAFKKEMEIQDTSHVCRVCKKGYTGYVKILFKDGTLTCVHDRPILFEDPHLTAGEQKRIGSRLSPNEIAVKGDDGMIRIIEK